MIKTKKKIKKIYKHIKYLQLFVTHIVKFATVADQFIKNKKQIE